MTGENAVDSGISAFPQTNLQPWIENTSRAIKILKTIISVKIKNLELKIMICYNVQYPIDVEYAQRTKLR